MLFRKFENIISWKNAKKIEIKKKIERSRSQVQKVSLYSPIYRNNRFLGKVSLCISLKKYRKASIAVETAFVLPVFFLGMLTVISFMDVYKEQTEHLVSLCEKAKTVGMYAYILNETGTEEITLPDIYAYQPIGGLVSLPKVWMSNQVTVHAWTGKESAIFSGGEEENEEMVYVTDSGTVYHTDLGCTYLNLSVNQIPGSTVKWAKNNYGETYGACACCSAGEEPAATVYVTKNGNCYHNLETCSALKRTVCMVKHSSVEGMAACSRCG